MKLARETALADNTPVLVEVRSHAAFALRQLEAAHTWQDARKRLFELHTMTHDEVAILPLWQLAEHYAHHAGLRGLGPKVAALYHDVEQWKIVTADK